MLSSEQKGEPGFTEKCSSVRRKFITPTIGFQATSLAEQSEPCVPERFIGKHHTDHGISLSQGPGSAVN